MDSDDEWHVDHLEMLISYLKDNPLIRWAQSEEKWIRNGKHLNKKLYHDKPKGWAFDESLSRCLVSPSAVIIHRSMFNQFGNFNELMRVCEDYDLWLRFLRYRPVGYVPKVTMIKYGGHSDQLSMSTPVMDRFRLFSLLHLLNDPANPHLNLTIKEKVIEKLAVLIQGASKRNHTFLPIYNSINQKVLRNEPIKLADISKIIFD